MNFKTKLKETEKYKEVNLRDNCNLIQYGYTQSASLDKIGPKFLRGTDIKTGRINWTTVPFCRISEADYEKYKLNLGDIVITRMGSPGDNAIIAEDIDAVFASYLIRIKLNRNLEPKFVFYFLQSRKYKRYIESIVSTSVQPGANARQLTDLMVPCPGKLTQQKIANILSRIDDKIETNQQINKTLEKIGQALFKHWFVDFEFPDKNGKPYKSSGGEMVDSELGKIPGGWCVGPFKEIIEITSGKRPNKKLDKRDSEFYIPLIGASSLMGYVNESLYDEPILIIGRVGTHGIVQRVMPPSFPSDNTLVIKTKFYEYVYQILKRIDYDSLNVGTTQPLITQSSIKNHRIIIPAESTLKNFEMIMSSLFNKVNDNNNGIENLSKIRDSLLPHLMSGRIRVGVA